MDAGPRRNAPPPGDQITMAAGDLFTFATGDPFHARRGGTLAGRSQPGREQGPGRLFRSAAFYESLTSLVESLILRQIVVSQHGTAGSRFRP